MTRHEFDSGSFLFLSTYCTGFCHNTGAPSLVYRTMSTFTAVVSPPSVRVPRVSRHAARHIATVKASSESAPRRRVVERVRDRILVSGSAALAASLVMGMGLHAPTAHAFVPIRGCGDPGSPYDTGVDSVSLGPAFRVHYFQIYPRQHARPWKAQPKISSRTMRW